MLVWGRTIILPRSLASIRRGACLDRGKMRITVKIFLAFLAVILLMWVSIFWIFSSSRKVLHKAIGENSVVLAVEILDQIDRNIHNRIELFQEYTKDTILQRAVLESNTEFGKLNDIQAYINRQDREWTSIPRTRQTGFMEQITNNELSKELREKTAFYEGKYGYQIFPGVFVTNKYGANVAQTHRTTDYRQDDELWWQTAKSDGVYVADIEYDKSARVYSTDIGIRIDDENGNFTGVLKAVLNVRTFEEFIKEIEDTKEYETAEFKLITRDGRIIYSSEDWEFLEQLPYHLLSQLRQRAGERGYFIAEGDKLGEGRELFAYACSKGYGDFKGLKWALIIEYETDELFAPIVRLKKRVLIISVIVTALALAVGVLISCQISRTVSKAAGSAGDSGGGDNPDSDLETKSGQDRKQDSDSSLIQSYSK